MKAFERTTSVIYNHVDIDCHYRYNGIEACWFDGDVVTLAVFAEIESGLGRSVTRGLSG